MPFIDLWISQRDLCPLPMRLVWNRCYHWHVLDWQGAQTLESPVNCRYRPCSHSYNSYGLLRCDEHLVSDVVEGKWPRYQHWRQSLLMMNSD